MSLIALKCPNCNGDIQLDDSKEFGFCMHCGTKVMIQEAVNRNVKLDHSDRLNNLIAVGKNTITGGSSADLLDTANKILEIDSDNWFGWYLRGVSASKAANCAGMYKAWEKAVEHIDQKTYLEYRDEFIDYAANASIGFGCEKSFNALPVTFMQKILDLEPEDEDRFAIAVIKRMCELKEFLNEDDVINTMINACFLAKAELILYLDLGCFMGCYEELVRLNNIIVGTKSIFANDEYGTLAEMYNTFLLPYEALNHCLETCKYSDEEFEDAIDYWVEHDTDEYLQYFNEASDLAHEVFDAGVLAKMRLKKQIKKNIETMVDVYVNH